MIAVDSGIWIDYFNGKDTREVEFLDRAFGVQAIAVGDLILTEVLQGFRSDKDFNAAKSLLDDFQLVEMLGRVRAISAAQKFRNLRKMGITIRKTNDVIIASYCIDEKLPLLYSDRDFINFERHLKLVSAIHRSG